MNIEMIKEAGAIIDHQDDPGFAWEEMREFWPDYMPEPDFTKEAGGLVSIFDGYTKTAHYCVDTPEDVLLSSMYFLKHGMMNFGEEDRIKIASVLKEYRDAFEVEIPRDFIDHIIKEAQVEEPEEVYADHEGRLPVTSKEQYIKSAQLFQENTDRWSAYEQVKIASNLMDAASYYGFAEKEMRLNPDYQMKIASRLDAARSLKVAYEANEELLETLEEYEEAISGLEFGDDIESMAKVASQLEQIDTEYGMNNGWNIHFSDPFNSVIQVVEKRASIDYSGLKEVLDSDVVDAIAADPDTIIPTLPMAEKQIVEDYINEQKGSE